MSKAARHALEEMGFEEIETPTMIKSTPEGVRDFVVPARLVPGSWYSSAAVLAAQQLLMVSGVGVTTNWPAAIVTRTSGAELVSLGF